MLRGVSLSTGEQVSSDQTHRRARSPDDGRTKEVMGHHWWPITIAERPLRGQLLV